jgi:hypothetical protein
MLGFDRVRSERALGENYPVQFWTFEDLKKHAQETAVIVPFASTLEMLHRSGFQTTVRFADSQLVYLH